MGKEKQTTKKEKTENAVFGEGCFWNTEEVFRKVKGVVKTTVGYMGGDEKKYPNPTYEKVCSDKTGFVEVCLVQFNPDIISYKKLLGEFWKSHDPRQINKQGPDFGTQYKSVIFYCNMKQKELSEKSKKVEQLKYDQPIATEIKRAKKFYRAEDYHQKYLMKRNWKTCRI